MSFDTILYTVDYIVVYYIYDSMCCTALNLYRLK